MNTSTGARVVIYARISEDTTGEAVGVSRQLDACRDFATDRGWSVAAEVTDNNISALAGKHRPGYQEVLRLVESGEVEHVVVWQTSRLLRNRRERAEAIELFGQQRVGIIAAKGISLDLSTAYGRGQAGLMGEFDTMESEVKAERIAAAAADRARRGRPSGPLGYGWEKSGTGSEATYVEHPHEAEVVREIVDRLLAGESLRGITESLNERREPAPKTATWGKTSVKKLALRESNIAVRVHHRGRSDEARYDGDWPALIDPTKHERVAALLTEPRRRSNGGVLGEPGAVARPGARRHLLSWGIAECGVCGARLRVTIRGNQRYGVKKAGYACNDGHVFRNQAAVDALVRDVAIERLSRPDALDWLMGDDAEAKRLTTRAGELRRRLDEAADAFAEGAIGREQLERITSRVRPDLGAVEGARSAAVQSLDVTALEPLAGPEALDRWEAMTVAQQRAVLEALGVRVVINKVERRGPGFDPESVRIEWKTGE